MLRNLFRSLRHRDFRVYYFGQLISITGTWMQNVAQAWLVYRLTGSSLLLGVVAFSSLLPVLLFGLPAGLLADRFPRRTLLIAAQLLAMLQALTLAMLVLSGRIEVWEIVLLAFLLGLVHALEMPSRHSFLAELVPREDLPNAIALNSSVFNIARFLGPAFAGWLVGAFGEGPVFLLNAATFLGVLLALFTIRVEPDGAGARRRGGGVFGGLAYAWGQQRIRAALLLLSATSTGGTAYAVLMPVFAHKVFGGGPELLGALLGGAGVGALIAAGRMAYLGGQQPLESNIGAAAITAGGVMLLFANTNLPWLALPLLVVQGFSLTTMVASINTLVQVLVTDQLRGRVMALFSVLFVGLTSVGNLLAGTAAKFIGAPHTVMLFAAASITAGAAYRRLRPKEEVSPDRQPDD